MQHQRIAYLLERYSDGTISEPEWNELHLFMESEQEQGPMHDTLREWLETRQHHGAYNEHRWQQVLNRILLADKLPVTQRSLTVPMYKKWRYRITAAAAIIIIALSAWWLISDRGNKQQPIVETTPAKNDVSPGKDGAILTLADGSKMVLDSIGNGIVAKQNGAQVVLKNGQLTYDADGKQTAAVTYNTMTTPKGRQFNVLLEDGTKVWLNAASSLRYPTLFKGKERRVEVSGEAYFEVAKNATMPFIVSINGLMEVNVLGTHFNVNAYPDEPMIHTTLLEGRVRVKLTGQHKTEAAAANTAPGVVLQPGQQAQLFLTTAAGPSSATEQPFRVQTVDVKEVIAWKEGAFAFTDADLPAVMRQLARWYNVEVEYAGAIPKGVFNGKIGRALTLAEVMEGLSETRVKFRIEGGNKIVVLP